MSNQDSQDAVEVRGGGEMMGPVVQEEDYYPFGLTFNEYNRENSVDQKFLFNGIERNKDLELNIYSARFRAMDPAIGRWWQLDPKPNLMISMYSAMDNNPIRYSDVFVSLSVLTTVQIIKTYGRVKEEIRHIDIQYEYANLPDACEPLATETKLSNRNIKIGLEIISAQHEVTMRYSFVVSVIGVFLILLGIVFWRQAHSIES